MFKFAICDDDFILSSEIEKHILNYGKKINEKFKVIVYWSGEELYTELLRGEFFDFLFLDIELSEKINGVDIGKNIRNTLQNNMIHIVYISSYKKYAMDLFKIRPLDFLVKPIIKDELYEVIDRGIVLSQKSNQRFSFKIGRDTYRIFLKDILWFKSLNREVEINTINTKMIFYASLEKIYQSLKEFNFFYPHKSYLVNYNQILSFRYSELVMVDGSIIPISQGKRKEIRKLQLEMEKL